MERGTLNPAQRDILLQPIADWRVQELDGQSHLAAWDVVAHLNRVFGFEGWDKEILSIDPVYEHVGEREIGHNRNCNRRAGCECRGVRIVPACSVGYRCTLRLSIYDTEGHRIRFVDDAAMGTATNQRDLGDAHDLALKSAVSYALKRCAKDLGDQFGLSLYNRGQRAACVGKVAVYGGDVAEHEGNVHADGIHEGDDGFGSRRGEGETVPQPDTEPREVAEPVEEGDPGAPVEVHPEPAPVREPQPSQPQKPEPTPPPQAKREVKPIAEEHAAALVEQITTAKSVDAVKAIWRSVDADRHLDILVIDPAEDGKQTTLRELMVRRVDEIGEGAA